MLDGHPSGFASPFHDLLPLAFCRKAFSADALKARDIEWLRHALVCDARYSRIERIARAGDFYLELAAGEFHRVNLGFDFAEFDSHWVKQLMACTEYWDPELIVATIYAKLQAHLQPSLYPEEFGSQKFYATLGDGDISTPERFLERFPNGKLIYMHREPIEICAALCARKPQPGNYRTLNNNQPKLFKKHLYEGLLKQIKNKNLVIERLVKDYPERVSVLNFQAFFTNFEACSEKISSFLEVDRAPSMCNYTFNGEAVAFQDGESMFSAPKDQPEKLLSARQMAIIEPNKSRHLADRIYGIFIRNFITLRSQLSKVKRVWLRLLRS